MDGCLYPCAYPIQIFLILLKYQHHVYEVLMVPLFLFLALFFLLFFAMGVLYFCLFWIPDLVFLLYQVTHAFY